MDNLTINEEYIPAHLPPGALADTPRKAKCIANDAMEGTVLYAVDWKSKVSWFEKVSSSLVHESFESPKVSGAARLAALFRPSMRRNQVANVAFHDKTRQCWSVGWMCICLAVCVNVTLPIWDFLPFAPRLLALEETKHTNQHCNKLRPTAGTLHAKRVTIHVSYESVPNGT